MTTTATPFDPVKDDNISVYMTLRGRTYRVQKVTSYEGGEFNEIFGDLAQVVVELFNATESATLRKVESKYNATADKMVDHDIETATVFASPPVPYTERELSDGIIQGDLRVYIPATALNTDSIYAFHEFQIRA